MATYKITPLNSSGMKVRTEHNTNNTSIGTLSYGMFGTGTDLWEADVDGNGAKKGDKWLFVEEGASVGGWVAIIHNGTNYCSIETVEDPDPEPEPEPTEFPAFFYLLYPNGEKKKYVISPE